MHIDKLKEAILKVPLSRGRRIIAIAGAPASGKSTLAEALAAQIAGARVLPMDGFHRSNEDLSAHGLLPRKGAPETFDVAGFEATVRGVRNTPSMTFPTFDREHDCVVAAGGMLTPSDQTILVEGNYLLLDAAPWDRMVSLWDFSIMLVVNEDELTRRLVQRWRDHGYDAAGALHRAKSNDLPNALYIQRHSKQADLTVTSLELD